MKYFRIEWSKTFIFATTFMKQRWLHIVLLFLLLILGGTQQTHAASAQDDDKELALQWLTFTRSQQKDQATLSDASEFVRICGSRSERVVPAQTVVTTCYLPLKMCSKSIIAACRHRLRVLSCYCRQQITISFVCGGFLSDGVSFR